MRQQSAQSSTKLTGLHSSNQEGTNHQKLSFHLIEYDQKRKFKIPPEAPPYTTIYESVTEQLL